MPCVMRLSTTGREDFLAPVGARITVRVDGPPGAGAEILHIQYAGGAIDSDSPFQFVAQPGPNFLSVLVEASSPGIQLHLTEVADDGSEQVLRRFHFDPGNPGRGFVVTGE